MAEHYFKRKTHGPIYLNNDPRILIQHIDIHELVITL